MDFFLLRLVRCLPSSAGGGLLNDIMMVVVSPVIVQWTNQAERASMFSPLPGLSADGADGGVRR